VAKRSRYLLRRDGSNWGWIGELSKDTLGHVGSITAALVERGPEWTHRRVETITLVDDRTIHRHLSLDFTLPRWVRTRLKTPDDGEVFLIPVTLLPRQDGPMSFDVRDEAGNALPLLTRRENSRLTGATLAEIAQSALRRNGIGGSVHEEIVAAIAYATTRPYANALPYVRSLIDPLSPQWRKLTRGSVTQRCALREDDRFCDFLGAFAANSLAYVPLSNAAGCHRVLKLTFNEEMQLARSPLTSLGWAPTVLIPRIPLVGLAETHHVQVIPPPNVEVTEAGLTSRRPCELIRAAVGSTAPTGGDTYRQFRGGPVRAVHFYQPRSHQLASGATWVALRAERRGLLFGAAIAALLITAMLGFFGLVTDAVVRQPSSASSLLLIAPGLVAAYLLRPGEHAMARKLLSAPRVFLVLGAAMAFAAAAVLVALYPEAPTTITTTTTSSSTPAHASSAVVTPGAPPHASNALEWSLRGLAIAGATVLLLLAISLIFPLPGHTDKGNRPAP
jgi:hypothetical protein